MRKVLLLSVLVFLSSCYSTNKITQLDPKTGYFPSNARVDILKKEKYDLDSMKSLILVSDDDFTKGQVTNINYFDKVIDINDLQTIIVREGLQKTVPAIRDRIGVNQAYINYRPFLWLRHDTRNDGREKYARLILTDPKNLEDLFVAEKYVGHDWFVATDQNTWYPLFNALIDYIKENSLTY